MVNAGWDLLIKLVDELGEDDLVTSFAVAQAEESTHLQTIKSWMEEAVLTEST